MPKYFASFTAFVEIEAENGQQATEMAEAMSLDEADFELDEIVDENDQQVYDDRLGALNLLLSRRKFRVPSEHPGISLYDWLIQHGEISEQEFTDTRNEFRQMTPSEQAHWAG
jgi:hypothetical protein